MKEDREYLPLVTRALSGLRSSIHAVLLFRIEAGE